jgi:hypothetical protein
MREAKAEAQTASYQANQEKRHDEEIKRLEAIAAKRALMKPAERLSTDTWVTPPGLKEEEAKQYEEAIKAAKEQFAKSKEAFGFGLECQRFVLAAGTRVYAFKPVDVTAEATLVPGDEKAGSSASIVLSCPGEKRGIDSFALDGSEATSVTSVTIPIAKEVDGKKLAESLSHLLTLTGKKKDGGATTAAATPQP